MDPQKQINAAVVKRIRELRQRFYSKPRSESLRRFIRRITKPSEMRFQSLLRGAFAEKRKEAIKVERIHPSEIKSGDDLGKWFIERASARKLRAKYDRDNQRKKEKRKARRETLSALDQING